MTPPSSTVQPTWETMKCGSVDCDFIDPEDFVKILSSWLAAPDQRRSRHVVTLNPEMVMLAEHDTAFREAVALADIRVPDGAGLIWAQWYRRSQFWSLIPSLLAFPFRAAERVTGVATVETIARLCAQLHQPLYLVGGTPTQVTKTAQLLVKKFPQLTVHTAASHTYDASGPAWLLADIQQKKPIAVLVAYGAPQQTIWIAAHQAALPSVRVAVGVGGAFAMLSEDRPRAPQWLRRLNLEWLWRLVLEPARLPRIWQATVRFPLLIKQQKQRS